METESDVLVRDKCIVCDSSYITLLVSFLKYDTNYNTDINITYCTNCFHVQLQNILPISDSIVYSNYINNCLLEISPFKQYLIIYYNSEFNYESPKDNLTYLNLYNDNFELLYNDSYKYDTIYCSNLLNIYDNPLRILNIIKHLSHDTTEIFVESPHRDIIKNSRFDIITPQRISYFSTYSMRNICNKANLYIHNISYHGDNIIYKLGISESIYTNVTDIILDELEHNLYAIETYQKFTIKYLIIRNTIRNLLLYFYLLELN